MGPTPEEFALALEPIAAGLRADGYGVDADFDGTQLSIRISSTPDACVECLMPKDVMTSIVVSELRRQGLALDERDVDLEYPSW